MWGTLNANIMWGGGHVYGFIYFYIGNAFIYLQFYYSGAFQLLILIGKIHGMLALLCRAEEKAGKLFETFPRLNEKYFIRLQWCELTIEFNVSWFKTCYSVVGTLYTRHARMWTVNTPITFNRINIMLVVLSYRRYTISISPELITCTLNNNMKSKYLTNLFSLQVTDTRFSRG